MCMTRDEVKNIFEKSVNFQNVCNNLSFKLSGELNYFAKIYILLIRFSVYTDINARVYGYP